MKDGSGPLLASIVVIAGVAIWMLGIDPVRPFRSENVIVRQEPEPPSTSSHAKAKPGSKPARSRIPKNSAVIQPAPTQKVSKAVPIDAGGQILSSTQKETIAKPYGEPALSISRIDRGHDLETLVYTRERGKEVTVILLKDGEAPSAHSPSNITPVLDTPRPRPDEHTAALLSGPAAPQPASIAIPAAAEAPKSIPKILDQTRAGVPAAIAQPARPSVQANVGTCGEYRDGKLTVKPCSEIPQSPSEWLAKGSGVTATESAPAGNQR